MTVPEKIQSVLEKFETWLSITLNKVEYVGLHIFNIFIIDITFTTISQVHLKT